METLKEELIKLISDSIIDPTAEDGSDTTSIEEWYLVNVMDFPLEDWDYENRGGEFEQIRSGVWGYMANKIGEYVMTNGQLPEGKWGKKAVRGEREWMNWLVDKAYVYDKELYSDEAIPYLNGVIKQMIRQHQLDEILG